jgi:hypothetical protein
MAECPIKEYRQRCWSSSENRVRRVEKLSAEARMRKLTPEQRSEIARKAVAAREAKRRAAKKSAAVRQKKTLGAT